MKKIYYDKFIRDSVKHLGKERCRVIFATLATSNADDWTKEVGRLGLRYLNTGKLPKPVDFFKGDKGA